MAQRICKHCTKAFEADDKGRGLWPRFCSDDCRELHAAAPKATHPACSIDGCETPRRSAVSPHCERHYYRLRRTGSLDVAHPQRDARGTCAYPGCDAADDGPHGYCAKHHTRIVRHGDPSIRLAPTPKPGPDNPNWRGDDITVKAAHQRVVSARGKATEHACVGCGGRAAHWSYDHKDAAERQSAAHGPYSVRIEHYQPRCVSCHKRFDLDHLAAQPA